MTPITSILIVDDEPTVQGILSRWARSLGLETRTASNADEALDALRAAHFDLAIIDLVMPGRDGLWLAAEVHREYPQTAVVLATAHAALLDGEPHPERPMADLLVKPFARDRFRLAVDRSRHWRKEALEDVQWHAALSVELRDRTENVCAQIEAAQGANEEELLTAIAARVPDTIEHGERVARYAVSVARDLDADTNLMATLHRAARFHDIGKVVMPERLLTKPSPLTHGEQAIMRRHVEAGTEILASTRTMFDLAPIVLATHEWFDGGGYPLKLARDAISPASRIIGVIDSYDAMTQDRSYRTRLNSAEAVSELLRCSGTQFDPKIVTAFLGVLGRQ